MTDQHTPGPWHVSRHFIARMAYIKGPNDELIAEVYEGKNGWGPDTEANAPILAAGPVMLNALQEVLDGYGIECNCGETCTRTCTRSKVLAAINAATEGA